LKFENPFWEYAPPVDVHHLSIWREKIMAMKLVKKTADYSIFKRKDGRYAVKDANKNAVNGEEKARILSEEGLITVTLPAAPAEEAPAEEAPAEETPVEEAPAEEAPAEEAPAEEAPAEEAPAEEDKEEK